MNRRDPPAASAAATSSFSRKSLIRDRVRRRRAAAGLTIDTTHGYSSINDGECAQGGYAAKVKNAMDNQIINIIPKDSPIKESPKATNAGLGMQTPSPQSQSSYGFDSNIECTLGSGPSKGSPFRYSPPMTTASSPFNTGETRKNDGTRVENSLFWDSHISSLWNPSFGSINPNGLWNPSYTSTSPNENSTFNFSDAKIVTPTRNNRSDYYNNTSSGTNGSPGLWNDEGVELPLDSVEFYPWSEAHSPGNAPVLKRSSSSQRKDGNQRDSQINSQRDAYNREKSKSKELNGESTVLNSVKIVEKRKMNTRAKAKRERIQRMRCANRLEQSSFHNHKSNEQSLHEHNMMQHKSSSSSSSSSRVPPSMDNSLHTASPVDAEKRFIQSRLQYMMDWTDGKDGRSNVVSPDVVSSKKSMLTLPTDTHVISVEETTPSMFSEDDSLYDNPYLRLNRFNVGEESGRKSSNRDAVTPIKGMGDISAVQNESGSVRELMNVSVDSRDIGRYSREVIQEETTAHHHDDREHVSPAVITPLKQDDNSNNVSLSPVQESEESLRDLHVSVDSRDIGTSVPVTRDPISSRTESRSSGKSVRSYAAPSFDEAASVRSRMSRDGNDSATTPTYYRGYQTSVGSKSLSGRQFRNRESVKQDGGELVDDNGTSRSIDKEINQSTDIPKENDVVPNRDSSCLSKEADHVINRAESKPNQAVRVAAEKDSKSPQPERSIDISMEAERVLYQEERNVSMSQLMESSLQEATWSTQAVRGSAKSINPKQNLPPIHPDRSTVASRDVTTSNQGRMQRLTRNNKSSIPSITEYSPTRSDHSADAAAGAKQLKTLIFGPLKDCPDPEGVYDEEKKLDPIPMQRVSKSFPAVREKTDQESCMSIDSWEVDIIGSKASSAVISEERCIDEVNPNEDHITPINTLKLSKHLEMKLEMLRQSSGASSDQQVSQEDDKSTMSSKVSVISIQPSVETACVQQNADIAMMMEDTMMDFMVIDGEEEVSVYSDGVDDASLQPVPSQDSGLLSNPSPHQGTVQQTDSIESSGRFNQPAPVDESEDPPIINPQFAKLQYAPPPAPVPKPILNRTTSRHQYFSKRHFPSLLSVDEEEEFSEPNFRLLPKSSNESLPTSTSTKASSPGKGLRVITKHKDLGKFLDSFRDRLMTGCAPLKDEDLASSWVFSQDNSQYNSILANDDVDERDECSDQLTSLPFSKGMTPQERALKRREDTTPLRTNTTKSVLAARTLRTSARITSSVQQTAMPEENVSYVNTVKSEPSIIERSADEANESAQKLSEDNDVMKYHSDVHRDSDGLPSTDQQKGEPNNTQEPEDTPNDEEVVETVYPKELVKMSERERHKSRSLHWNSNNGVNEDEQYSPPKFVPMRSRARISPRVLSSKMSLSAMSSYQASIRQHFRGAKHDVNDLYNPRSDEQKLGYIHECSREEDSESSEDEAADNDKTPEYAYDDFLKDFSTIAADVNDVLSRDEKRDDEALEFRSTDMQSELQSKESYSTLYELPSVLASNQRKPRIQLSPTKSNVSSSDSILDQSRPHSVTTSEVSRTMLEDKLRQIGAMKKDSGSSVATSDLGSIMTRESEFSKNYNIPKMIFHRTHPQNNRSSDSSARSSPSSMGNTYNNSTMVQSETLRIKYMLPENAPPNILPQNEPPIDPNEHVILSKQKLRRENSAATAAATIGRPQLKVDPNEDVVMSQRLLKNNVASATSSAATIEQQLARLRSIRSAQRNKLPQSNDEALLSTVEGTKTTVQTGGSQMGNHRDNEDSNPSSLVGVGALKMKYQQLISPAFPDANASSKRVISNHASNHNTIEDRSEVAKISSFWKQFELSGDASVDKPRPNNGLQKKPSINRAKKLHDDASQQSGDIFEIAPRGNGQYGVLNKNQWIKDHTSTEDPSMVQHDVYESSSNHAFEVSPMCRGHDSVVAKLPSKRHQTAPNRRSPEVLLVKRFTSCQQTPNDESLPMGNKVTPSPFLKKTSASSPFLKKTSMPNQGNTQNTSRTKSVMSRANIISSSWKTSPTKKPPTVLNRSISTEKLNSTLKSGRKKDTSWILKGKNDNSWIGK